MALLSIGGTSIVERCARASTRLVASRVATASMSATGRAAESSTSSASSTDRRPLFTEFQKFHYEKRNRGVVVQIEQGQLRLHFRVGGEGHDVRIVGMQERLARLLAPYLELRDGRELEALHQQHVARRDLLHLLVERGLLRAAQLVHQHPSARGGHQDLARPRLPVPVRVLAGRVHVEAVVRVLDQRNAQAAPGEARDQLLDQRGLAAAGPAGEAESLHRPTLRASAARSAASARAAEASMRRNRASTACPRGVSTAPPWEAPPFAEDTSGARNSL